MVFMNSTKMAAAETVPAEVRTITLLFVRFGVSGKMQRE